MTILKELLYTISSLPQIVNVSSTNTPNENIDTKNLEKLLSFINAQEGTINKIVNGKGLYQKRFETLTLEEKKNFFKEVMRNSATTKEQKNIIEEKLKDDKFVNEHLDSFFDSTIQNIIRAKSNENKSKKQLKNDLKEKKRLETDPEHYINDSSEVSSKKIYAELKQLEGILKEYEIILKPLLKKIKMIETIKYSLNLLQILLAASIVATTMVGIFFPPALTAIPHLSLASFAIGAIQIALEMYVTELKQLNNNNQNLLKALSVAFRGYGQLGVEKLLSKSYTRIDKIYGSNLTNKLNIILAIWSGIQNIRSAIASENEIRQIISLRDKMHTLSKGFISRWINFRERNIFVDIKETKQHGDYHEDGYGGQNILFKNLDENKIYTLEEMLDKKFTKRY